MNSKNILYFLIGLLIPVTILNFSKIIRFIKKISKNK